MGMFLGLECGCVANGDRARGEDDYCEGFEIFWICLGVRRGEGQVKLIEMRSRKVLMELFKSRDFQSPKTGESYVLHQGNQVPIHSENIQTVTSICNQDDVYALFKGLKGRAYSEDDAVKFFQWIDEGWKNQSHFVFLATTKAGDIAAALDIKSNTFSAAEIGYWCDQRHRGITHAAVLLMIEWAKDRGFQSLFAKPINTRSAALLARVGFMKSDSPDSVYGHWILNL